MIEVTKTIDVDITICIRDIDSDDMIDELQRRGHLPQCNELHLEDATVDLIVEEMKNRQEYVGLEPQTVQLLLNHLPKDVRIGSELYFAIEALRGLK